MSVDFEERLAKTYNQLSTRLREACDFIEQNQVYAATRPLRSVAQEAGIAPATFSRLAKALGYESFDALRDSLRDKIGAKVNSFADRAHQIQVGASFAQSHAAACYGNVGQLVDNLDEDRLNAAADRLHAANKVYLFGALGATGIVEYLSYLAHFCFQNWELVGRQGTSLGGGLVDIGPEDVFLVVTKPPFSSRGLRAAQLAKGAGAHVIVISDTHKCPALQTAHTHFIVPTQSPHFYSSFVATLALLEILIGLVVGRAGTVARDRIAKVEQSNLRLDEVCDG